VAEADLAPILTSSVPATTAPSTPAATKAKVAAAAATSSPAAKTIAVSTGQVCGDSRDRAAVATGRTDAFQAGIAGRARTKKLVFAHYMPTLPLSLDNHSASTDYYTTHYLKPGGENGKFSASGGFMRDRPLGRQPITSGNWRLKDLRTEVSQATRCGLDGFTLNLLQTDPSSTAWKQSVLLMKASAAQNKNFKIMLMPDMSALGGQSPGVLAAQVAELAAYPSAFRLADGRVVISPFMADSKSVDWWSQFLDAMRARGHQVAFFPVFVNSMAFQSFAPISYGFGNWGNRNPSANSATSAADGAPLGVIKQAHRQGKGWMQPVSFQDERPATGVYDESQNSRNLRNSWNIALKGRADWIQLATWNDYTEGSQFAPSVKRGWSHLQMSQYYMARFRTGSKPKINGNQLFVTHRTQSYRATPSYPQQFLMRLRSGSSPARDTVEAMVLLSAPATIRITVGGQSYSCSEGSGLHTCTVPLSTGKVSASIVRGGRTISVAKSSLSVVGQPYVQDLQYVGAIGRPAS
jgi:hypothetical protein